MSATILFRIIALCSLIPPLCGSFTGASARQIHVAVASNFADAVKEIAALFEQQDSHTVVLSFGSTGKLYSQIVNGAPFDIFLAADAERPERLEKEGVALPSSRFTYAIGCVVLWSPDPKTVDSSGTVLGTKDFRRLALANPALAPFGRAAKEILQNTGTFDRLRSKFVFGENIAQTFQFIKTGAVELGFISRSQICRPGVAQGSFWVVPQSLYSPVIQQAVLLHEGNANRAFLKFLSGDRAIAIIQRYGYRTP